MKNAKHLSLGHAKTHLRYHIIFSTKYRKKCLNQIHDSVIEAFKKSEINSHYKILTMELDKDHIHLLITFKPFLSISQVVRKLKQLTTKYIWDQNEIFLRKFYHKNKILWTHGYFCSTIGEVSEITIKKYIENKSKTF